MDFVLTKPQLYEDLYRAYKDARRHKRSAPYVQKFEENVYWELQSLCDELYERRYKPSSSTFFIIKDPKMREVVAADFRDRIVHHLYFNYTYEIYRRTFIEDSYSCMKGRGTHYGIHRLEQHIRKESKNYTLPCYVMKLDIKGYFMSINRIKLLSICEDSLKRMSLHFVDTIRKRRWNEERDFDFLLYLTEVLVLNNPMEGCRCIGYPEEWEGLPPSRSLFCSEPQCGLPIGNLTSQLFSNVYLNSLDQWMKRSMKCVHYGRYVDDFYVVSRDKDRLKDLLPKVRVFLKESLDLTLHEGKIVFADVRFGVGFLGAYLKPWRTYVLNSTVYRIRKGLEALQREMNSKKKITMEDRERVRSRLNSYLGLLSHWKSYFLRFNMMIGKYDFSKYGEFDEGLKKFEID